MAGPQETEGRGAQGAAAGVGAPRGGLPPGHVRRSRVPGTYAVPPTLASTTIWAGT